jgi:hypothetical protein
MTITILDYSSGIVYMRDIGSVDPEEYIVDILSLRLKDVEWMETNSLNIKTGV